MVCLGIGLRFAWFGYWMILPFAILDIVAVGLILRHVIKRSHYIEQIKISESSFEIHHIEPKKNKSWSFPLHWTQVRLKAPSHPWYPQQLLFGSKGEWVEVGQCLTDEERKLLAERVRGEIARMQQQ